MNIYVEANFVLELVFGQEQHESCKQILDHCNPENGHLIVPAYCLVEPHEKLTRQAKIRSELQQNLNSEIRQLVRTASYTARIDSIQDIKNLLLQSIKEEKQRLLNYRDRILDLAKIIPFTIEILREAAMYKALHELSPQDALVYTSVITHLRINKPPVSCFLNRNSKDFEKPDIVNELDKYNCKMIPRFDHGYRFIQAQQ